MACLGVLGLSWVIGYGLCRAVLGPVWRDSPPALRLGLAWTAGAAFSGMTTFWAIALTPSHRGLTVGLFTFAGLSLTLVRPKRVMDQPSAPPEPWRWRDRAAWRLGAAAFMAILSLWLVFGIELGRNFPSGDWDAWSIWTLRARFFYLCPSEWTRGLDRAIDWAHPEYPVLVPSLIVYAWLPAGRCLAVAPVAVGLMTHVALLLLIVGLTQAAYPRSAWPWAFGIFYATIPVEWTQKIAWQYADRPLAVFLLAGVGCLALALRQNHWRWLPLAGFFYGAASFCKDEGKAAVLVLGLGTVLAASAAILHKKFRRVLGGIALLGLGLAPGIASLALQRHYSPLPSKLLSHMTAAPLTDTGRTAVILQFVRNRFGDPTCGGLWWACGLVLVALFPWLRRRELWLLWAIPTAQFLIYLVIFQLTPEDLNWHLDSAMPRLLFHIGPLFFLASAWLILEANREIAPASADAA